MLVVALASTVLAPAAWAASGGPEPRFGDDGITRIDLANAADHPIGALGGPAGSLVVATQGEIGSSQVLTFRRTLPTGAPDPAFGVSGRLDVQLGVDAGRAELAEGPLGTIVARVARDGRTELRRILVDGTIDRSFGGGTVTIATPDARGSAHAVDTLGRVTVAWAAGNRLVARRIGADGRMDEEYGEDGTASSVVPRPEPTWDTAYRSSFVLSASARADGGTIVVTGTTDQGWTAACLAALTPSGSLDPGFDGDGYSCSGRSEFRTSTIPPHLDAQGRIIFLEGGYLRRVLPDGSVDRSFGEAYGGGSLGVPGSTEATSFAVQGDRIYASGERFNTPGTGPLVVAFDSTGMRLPDTGPGAWSFVDPLPELHYTLSSIVVRPLAELTGPVTLVGSIAGDSLVIAVGRDGKANPLHGRGGVTVTNSATAADEQLIDIGSGADGSTVVLGMTDTSGAILTRLEADGDLDTTFGDAGRLHLLRFRWEARVAGQLDGKVLVAGPEAVPSVEYPPPPIALMVRRYLTNGELDPTFGNGGVVVLPVPALAPDIPDWDPADVTRLELTTGPNGSIVVATAVAHGDVRVARLSASGQLDATFGGGLPVRVPLMLPETIEVLADGSVVVGGYTPLGDPGGSAGPYAFVRLTSTGARASGYGVDGTVVVDPGMALGCTGGDVNRSGAAGVACQDGLLRVSASGVVTRADIASLPGYGHFHDAAIGDDGVIYSHRGALLRWPVGGKPTRWAPTAYGDVEMAADGGVVVGSTDAGHPWDGGTLLIEKLSQDPNSTPVITIGAAADVSAPEGRTARASFPVRMSRTMPYDVFVTLRVSIGVRQQVVPDTQVRIPKGATAATAVVEVSDGLAYTRETVRVVPTTTGGKVDQLGFEEPAIQGTAAATGAISWTAPLPPTEAPRITSAKAGVDFVTVAWDELTSAQPPVVRYGIVARQGGRVVATGATPSDDRSVSIVVPSGPSTTVAVYACNKGGCGPERVSAAVRPGPTAPLGAAQPARAPSGVRAYPAQTGVGVFWEPAVDGGRPITHYALLAIDRTTQVPVAFTAVPSDVRQHTFAKLNTNRRYDVWIAAFDGSAWGALAAVSAADTVTYGDTVPDEPRFVAAYPSGHDSLVAFGPSWHDRGQPIDLYSVVVVDAAGAIVRWINVGPTERFAYLADLPAGRTLSVYVAAHNSSGFSTGGRPANLRV